VKRSRNSLNALLVVKMMIGKPFFAPNWNGQNQRTLTSVKCGRETK